MTSDGESIDAFLAAMQACGVNLDTTGGHPIADGQLHRASALGKKKKRNDHVWYVLHLDEPASGAFGDMQLGVEDTWTAKRPNAMTQAERDSLKRRMQEAQEQRAAQKKALNVAAAAAAAEIMKASGKASPEHPYLARKRLLVFPGLRQLKADVRYSIEEGERPRVARKGSLAVPIFTPAAELVGVQLIGDDGTKRFLKGTAKEGNYHSIGRPSENDGDVIIIAEGYATGARLHEAAGALVIVAFDSGNLAPVAKAIRKKYPKARLLFAADNDRFTVKPVDNPGVTKAREAADAVKGLVAVPAFDDSKLSPEDIEAGRVPTDFDDLARLDGIEAVRTAIDAVLNPQRQEAPRQEEPPPYMDMPDGPRDDDFGDIPDPLEFFGAPHFRCLGVDGTTCYYQPSDVAQVIELSASSHKFENLAMLAPLQWWEAEFPGAKEGVDWKAAVNACIRACKKRRKFIPHNAVRGRGAWFEGSAAIYHAGDHMIVDGHRVDISRHASRYVYDEGDAVPVDIESPAATAEARRFLELCKSLRWVNPLSAYMLAGWCVLAPVCGFLRWRPHIWLNGQAGSGKSTVMDRIVKVALGATAHTVVGATTEAGIRNMLGTDAMPVVFDESEPKDMHNQQRIRAILDLARVASSEGDGLIIKGTANQKTKGFRARFMAVFASINTQIEGYADETRFTQLTLAAPEVDTEEQRAAAAEHYEKLLSDMVDLLTDDYARQLLARTILNLPVLRKNVEVFTVAAREHLGSQRLGDQVGPMLAGAYLLNSTKAITVEDALKWIRSNDWTDHSAKSAARDSDRFIQQITGYVVRHNTPEGGTWERTIGELIEMCAYDPDVVITSDGLSSEPNKRKAAAAKSLARLGIRVWYEGDETGYVVDITTSHASFKNAILRGTEWAGTNIRNLLKAIDGVQTPKGNRYFASGVNTPYVTVPINALLGEREPGEEG